jgi:pimeloyl-ACP methyl ester carboxylesterase
VPDNTNLKRTEKRIEGEIAPTPPQSLEETRYNHNHELIPVDSEQGSGMVTAGVLGVVGAAAIGAGYIYNKWSTGRTVRLPEALEAPRHTFHCAQARKVDYYADATAAGRPLVLIHSINAAAGAHEMRPIFEQNQGRRPVYALDLPGYGFSDRSRRAYSPDLFAGVIAAFLRTVVREPADVVALSLGCEFAARAAQIEPALVNSLVLISPSGFSQKNNVVQGLVGTRTVGSVAHATLALPILSQALFDAITTESSIKYYLRKSFVGEPPAWLTDYAYATAHQPGAKHAPLYFLSGLLFTPKAYETLYPGVQQPVLVIHDDDPYVSFDLLPAFVAQHPNWQVCAITPTLGLPHWEKPVETAAALDEFWQQA